MYHTQHMPEWTFTFSFLKSPCSPDHSATFLFLFVISIFSRASVQLCFLLRFYLYIHSLFVFSSFFSFCFLSLFSHSFVICSSGEFANFLSSGQDLWMLAHSKLFFAKHFKYSFLRIDFYGDTQLVLSLGPAFLLSNRTTICQLAW